MSLREIKVSHEAVLKLFETASLLPEGREQTKLSPNGLTIDQAREILDQNRPKAPISLQYGLFTGIGIIFTTMLRTDLLFITSVFGESVARYSSWSEIGHFLPRDVLVQLGTLEWSIDQEGRFCHADYHTGAPDAHRDPARM